MTAAALRRPGSAELRLDAILLTVTAAAWALTADRMAGMDAGAGAELGGLGWFAVSWLLMMAAMMLPALVPMVVEHGHRAAHAGCSPPDRLCENPVHASSGLSTNEWFDRSP